MAKKQVHQEKKKRPKTKKTFIQTCYQNMKDRVNGVNKDKAHLYRGLDILPREEFYRWAEMSNELSRLYKDYEESGFKRGFAPSIDRIDPAKGYVLSNMRWLIHSENSRRGRMSHATNERCPDCRKLREDWI